MYELRKSVGNESTESGYQFEEIGRLHIAPYQLNVTAPCSKAKISGDRLLALVSSGDNFYYPLVWDFVKSTWEIWTSNLMEDPETHWNVRQFFLRVLRG